VEPAYQAQTIQEMNSFGFFLFLHPNCLAAHSEQFLLPPVNCFGTQAPNCFLRQLPALPRLEMLLQEVSGLGLALFQAVQEGLMVSLWGAVLLHRVPRFSAVQIVLRVRLVVVAHQVTPLLSVVQDARRVTDQCDALLASAIVQVEDA